MVGSSHGLLGNGCRLTEPEELKSQNIGSSSDPMKLNYVGNTFLTHFIHFLMPVALYKESPESFDLVLQQLAADYKLVFDEGIKVKGLEKMWACCVACKGGSPYTAKTGHFDRSFYHRPLKATSKTPGVGVCHCCLAGVESLPQNQRVEFEEFGPSPGWLRTQELVAPWSNAPPFLAIPRETANPNGERFWQFDLFHNFHLGAGKYFVSSAMVHIVQTIFPQPNIDARFDALTRDFQRFCKQNKLHPYYKNLTKQMFGVQLNHKACPSGNWPKGDQTTLMAVYLEDFCKRAVVGKVHDPTCLKIASWQTIVVLCFCYFLSVVLVTSPTRWLPHMFFQIFLTRSACPEAEAVEKINEALRGLYHHGVWIEGSEARRIATCGIRFLQLYADLARLAFQSRSLKFPLQPKFHYCNHTFVTLLQQSSKRWALNPLIWAVQMQEDYIGKPSRISRRCNPRSVSHRVLQRTFLATRQCLRALVAETL